VPCQAGRPDVGEHRVVGLLLGGLLRQLRPDDVLPGGLLALHDGREGMETPLYLPERRALVFADGMTAPEGTLRIWKAPGYRQRVLPAFRKMPELPFERVLASHGEPVHDRTAFEAALDLPLGRLSPARPIRVGPRPAG
jgi:hypothetical protein